MVPDSTSIAWDLKALAVSSISKAISSWPN